MSDPSKKGTTMKAVVATGFGEIDDNIFLREDWPRPELDPSKPNGNMVVRVLACALAPGDARVLSGSTDFVQLPKGGHPYVVGSDVCGVVEQVEDGDKTFSVGDLVVSRFELPSPSGGLAEYRLVKTSLSAKAPNNIDPIQSCGLPASAMTAKLVVTQFVKQGDRVLLLGASGGVGTFACQYIKLQGASFLAATSTATESAKSLGVDHVIDYRKQKWWQVPEFQKDKFDVVIDLVNGEENWNVGGKSGLAVKRRGYYVLVPPGVQTEVQVHGVFDLIRINFEFIGGLAYSWLNPFIPKWRVGDGLDLKPGDLDDLVRDVESGKIRVVLDPESPFPFTQAGARQAMALQKSTHAHGKVVVKIADK